MKVLTKSKFKTGLSCPNKLFYAINKEYVNNSADDSFLATLAEGGFQVEALARLHYPNGVFIDAGIGDYTVAWNKTKLLLENDNTIIYEASFLKEDLYVMSDIVVKKGNTIKLIEVKAKSFDSSVPNEFLGKNGKIRSEWKPYLFDIAFQKYVIQLCYPNLNIESYFILADKSKKTTIDGLNQRIRLPQNGNERREIQLFISPEDAQRTSVLSEVNVSDIVNEIILDKQKYSATQNFSQSLSLFKEIIKNNRFPNSPTSFTSCKNCEFKTNIEQERIGRLSGFKNCFETMHGFSKSELESPMIFDIWSFRGQKYLKRGDILMKQLNKKDFLVDNKNDELAPNERRWIQIEKAVSGNKEAFINRKGLKRNMEKWKFPLHFIDFETSSVAIPFNKGMKPYEQVAFQFSHHVVKKDGKIIHESQFIQEQTGEFPNFNFIEKLKLALDRDDGTVFRFAAHENSILNAIKIQLEESDYINKDELIRFIKSLAKPKGNSEETWIPTRDFVDLRDLIVNFYYHPLTKGSNSIKAVLPAILNSCEYLQSKYTHEIGKINLTSLNFEEKHVWIKRSGNDVSNPYKLLPPLFKGWTLIEKSNLISGLENINDGGAALTAYGKLQFTEMSEKERQEINNSLLKYCELDTLAMVMIYEHLKHKVY